jgi:hypothetical protein
MPKRPTELPTFATNPSAGAVVVPIDAVRNAGFATDDIPPAAWFNWLFNSYGRWLTFLRGFDPSNCARWTFSTTTFTRFGVDSVTAEGGVPLHRIVGIGGSSDTHVWSSVRGETWLQRNLTIAAGTFGTPTCVTFGLYRWFVGTATNIIGGYTGTGAIWWTYAEGNPGYGTSAIGDDTQNWHGATLPGATTDIRAIADGTHPTYGEAIVAITNTAILAANTIGAVPGTLSSFAAATLSAAVTAGAKFRDVVFSGGSSHTGQWVAVTDKGDLYTASNPTGTWTKNPTNIGVQAWRLATDGLGNVVAYISGTIYLSIDDGATWAAGTAPPFSGVVEITYLDGAWFCTTTGFAPYLATSPDLSANSWLRVPTPYVETQTMDLGTMCFSQGALVIAGSGVVLVSKRAADTSPAPWAPDSTPVALHDAAYLRGNLVDGTVPTNGERLIWRSSSSSWVAGDRYVATATDYVAAAGDRTVGVTSTASARAITMPPSPSPNDRFTVKDESNGAATHNITITPASGTVEGAANAVINTNRGCKTFYFNGTNWFLESSV